MNDKGINNLSVEKRIAELNDYALLHSIFGDLSFRAIGKYNFFAGYSIGFERMIKLLRDGRFDKEVFEDKPIDGICEFLQGYFTDRGGNQPEIWSEYSSVFLKTRSCKFCVTIEAEKSSEKCHDDVCAIYCRSFAKGLVKVLEEFYPGLVINFYNFSSRRDGKDSDCVEAFQVVTPSGRNNI
jgi:hypothetical protein